MFADEEFTLNRLKSKENVLNILFSDAANSSTAAIEKSNEEEKSEEEKADKDALDLLDFAINGKRRGRGPELSYQERADIGVMGTLIGHYGTSKMLGVSVASPQIYVKGKVNFYDEDGSAVDQDKRYRKRIKEIRDMSAEKLLITIGAIPDEKLTSTAEENPLKATQIATNLSRIIEKVSVSEREDKPTAQFFIYQPQQAKEEEYEVIDV